MKAVCAVGDGRVELRDVPAPTPRAGQLLIRAACSLISPGTELHYADKLTAGSSPLMLGYCSSGYVEQVGDRVEGFEVGDRVTAMGWGYAVHAEAICVPYRLCVKMPAALSFERAVFANLAATALHAVHRAQLNGSEGVLVVGAGLVGQLVAQIARLRSTKIFVADRLPGRLRIAELSGVHRTFNAGETSLSSAVMEATRGEGVNVVFLCVTGEATSTVNDSVKAITSAPDGQPRGTIVCVGRFDALVNFSVELGNVDLRYSARCGAGYRDDAFAHGLRDYAPPPGEGTVTDNLRECLRLIDEGSIQTSALLTHRVPFERATSAYELFKTPDAAVGVTLHYEN